MKKLSLFAFAAMILFGIALTQNSYAQVDPTGNPQNRGIVKPNFIDADGDGICDNNTSGTVGTGTGQMSRGGKGGAQGSGSGTGTGTGSGIHQRLRDGSCLDGTEAATLKTSASTNRQGRNRSVAPSK